MSAEPMTRIEGSRRALAEALAARDAARRAAMAAANEIATRRELAARLRRDHPARAGEPVPEAVATGEHAAALDREADALGPRLRALEEVARKAEREAQRAADGLAATVARVAALATELLPRAEVAAGAARRAEVEATARREAAERELARHASELLALGVPAWHEVEAHAPAAGDGILRRLAALRERLAAEVHHAA